MDSIFLHLQNFNVVSYSAFGIVLISFIIEAKSNSPYKSLFLSNIGFGIYHFNLLTGSEFDFPIYFILLSFLICSWFFVLKNIEEEEDQDRGFLRNYYNDSIIGLNETADKNNKENFSLEKDTQLTAIHVLNNNLSKLFESEFMLIVRIFLKNDIIYYRHPQRKFVHASTYLILTSILVSFFLVQ